MSNFHDLGLSKEVLRAANSEGYEIATPIQVQAIPEVLAGRDLIGNAQTGTGKTAAFAMPTLDRLRLASDSRARDRKPGGDRDRRRDGAAASKRIRALVLAPTRELAAQIGESFSAYGKYTGVENVVIHGGVGQSPQVRAIRRGVDVLIATPGRLEDLMAQGIVSLRDVEILILDEADHMLDIGFIHALKRIVKTVPANRQTLMFSATMPPEIRRLSREWLTDPVHVQVAPVATPADDVEQSIYRVEKKHKPRLLEVLLRELPGSRALAFTRTKHGADKVVKHLKRGGLLAAAIHGNKSQGQRQRALDQFKSGQIDVLVATDIAARGLDIDAVTHVFNLDLPEVAEVYVHRIGRTGRAGAEGKAISFCASDQEVYLRAIEKLMNRPIRVERAPRAFESGEFDAPPPTRAPERRARDDSREGQGRGGRGGAARGGRSGRPRPSSRRERDDRGGSGGGRGGGSGSGGGGRGSGGRGDSDARGGRGRQEAPRRRGSGSGEGDAKRSASGGDGASERRRSTTGSASAPRRDQRRSWGT